MLVWFVVEDPVAPAADDLPRLIGDNGSDGHGPGHIRLPHEGEHLGPGRRKVVRLGHVLDRKRAR